MIRQKIKIEFIEDFDKTLCANVSVDGELVTGIVEKLEQNRN